MKGLESIPAHTVSHPLKNFSHKGANETLLRDGADDTSAPREGHDSGPLMENMLDG